MEKKRRFIYFNRAGVRWGRVLLVFGAIGLSGGAVEIAGRVFLEPVNRVPLSSWPFGLVIADDLRGYRYAPDFVGTVERDGRKISIRTNSLGLRERALSPADRRGQLLALGDSFTVGFGVGQREAWPARLEAGLAGMSNSTDPPRVINAGVSGYSLAQIRLTAQELVPLLRPRLIVVGIYGSSL
jgi:hypothetical protein